MERTSREHRPKPTDYVAELKQGVSALTRVEALGLSREYSFETGIVQNTLIFRLPHGQVVRVEIPESSAQDIIQSLSGWTEPPTEQQAIATPSAHSAPVASELFSSAPEVAMPTNREYSPAMLPDDEGLVFAADAPDFSVAETPLEPRPERPLRIQGPTRERPPVVDMDECGNPVLKGPGYVDVSALLGGESPDEDGVGQL